jgi:hypothetical protein
VGTERNKALPGEAQENGARVVFQGGGIGRIAGSLALIQGCHCRDRLVELSVLVRGKVGLKYF